MSSAQEKVLDLVASGKISTSEADQLLAAMAPPRAGAWRLVFLPAERVSAPLANGLGVLAAAAMLALERLGVAFDGALDTHVVGHPVPWSLALAHLVVAWPLPALAFWVAGKLAAKPARLIDVSGAVALARLPLAVAGAAVLPLALFGADASLPAWKVGLLIVALPLFAWGIALLCTGFRTVTGLRGGRLAVATVGALFAAELSSKLLLGFS